MAVLPPRFWQRKHVHAMLKRKLDAAAPHLLTDAWHHCQLDFHFSEGDDLSSSSAKLLNILTSLQAEGKLCVQYDKPAVGTKADAEPSTSKGAGQKRKADSSPPLSPEASN